MVRLLGKHRRAPLTTIDVMAKWRDSSENIFFSVLIKIVIIIKIIL